MTKKKKIILIIFFLIIAFLIVFINLKKLPDKEDRNILGYPAQHNRGSSHVDLEEMLLGDERYYFEYKGYLYYHQPKTMSVSGYGSSAKDFKIKNGDPGTFTIIDSNYAKDENQVYYWGYIVDQADPDTFETLDWPRAKDKNYYFNQTQIEGNVK